MVAIDDWLEHISPDCFDCPESVIKRELLGAMVNFCERSQIWKYDGYAQPVIEGISDYVLEYPDDEADISNILSVRMEGKTLSPSSRRELDSCSPNWRERSGKPRAYVVIDKNQILLDRKPQDTEINVLGYTVSLKPLRTSTAVPDWLFTDWLDALACGAKARVLKIPGRKWTNLDMASYYQQHYQIAVNEAKTKANKDWGTQSLKVKKRKIV